MCKRFPGGNSTHAQRCAVSPPQKNGLRTSLEKGTPCARVILSPTPPALVLARRCITRIHGRYERSAHTPATQRRSWAFTSAPLTEKWPRDEATGCLRTTARTCHGVAPPPFQVTPGNSLSTPLYVYVYWLLHPFLKHDPTSQRVLILCSTMIFCS